MSLKVKECIRQDDSLEGKRNKVEAMSGHGDHKENTIPLLPCGNRGYITYF